MYSSSVQALAARCLDPHQVRVLAVVRDALAEGLERLSAEASSSRAALAAAEEELRATAVALAAARSSAVAVDEAAWKAEVRARWLEMDET